VVAREASRRERSEQAREARLPRSDIVLGHGLESTTCVRPSVRAWIVRSQQPMVVEEKFFFVGELLGWRRSNRGSFFEKPPLSLGGGQNVHFPLHFGECKFCHMGDGYEGMVVEEKFFF
jgi:hypothetical protein